MAVYDDEQYEANRQLFERMVLGQSLNSPEDDDRLDSMLQNAFNRDNVSPIFGTGTSLRDDSASRVSAQSPANQRLVRNYTIGLIDAEQNPVSGLDDYSNPDPLPLPPQMIDTNAAEIFSWDGSYAKRNRRELAGALSRTYSADYALGQWMDRWKHRDDPKISPQEATNMAREQGADVKFNRPVSDFEVAQSINSYLKRKQFEDSLALVEYYGGNQGKLNDLAVIGSQLINGVGPVELGVTVVGGIVIPELAVAGAARAAGIVRTALQAKKVNDAVKAVEIAKNANRIARGATELAQTVRIGTQLSDDAAAAAVMMRTGASAERLSALDRTMIKAAGQLEKMQGMRYANLTTLGKMNADALAFGMTDLAFIQANRENSKRLGWEQYSEQDKAVDTLLAFGLGVGVPTAARGVASKLGILPRDLIAGRIKNMRAEISTKEALGEISTEEAAQGRKALKDIEKALVEEPKEYRATSPKVEKIANDMASINTSDETLHAQSMYVLGNLMNGNKIDLSKMPQYEALMSSLDNRYIKRLGSESAQVVFSGNLVEDSTRHIQKIRVRGESGYFQNYNVSSLAGEDASEHLADLYRGYILKDAAALERYKEWALRSKNFANDMRGILERIQEQIATNRAHKAGESQRYYSARTLYQNKALMRNAYLNYRLAPDEAKRLISDIEKAEHASYSGYSTRLTLPPEDRTILEEFENWFHKYIKEVPTKNRKGREAILLDPINAEGKMDYGATLAELADELDDAANNNISLAATDAFLETMNVERARAWANDAAKLDVSANTDIDNLLGMPRRTYKELEELAQDEAATNEDALIAKMEYDNKLSNPELSTLLNGARQWSNVSSTKKSSLDIAITAIEKIPEIKKAGFDDVKNNILQALRTSPRLQERIKAMMIGSSNQANIKALELAYRTALSRAINANAELREALGREAATAINRAVQIFKREIETNPNSLEAFLNPEDLAARYEIPEFGSAEKTIETAAKVRTSMSAVLGGVDKAFNIALSNREIQSRGNVCKFLDKMEAMRAHPAYAAEIITGGATQSIYTWRGSQRSIEHLTRHAGNYVHDLRNELARTESEGGTTLLDVYRDNNNKTEIFNSMIRQKWNAEENLNSDYARIATAIMKREATIMGGFKGEGIEYTHPSTLIKRSNMQYVDAAITDAEIAQIEDGLSASLNMESKDIVAMLQKGTEENTVLRGNTYVELNDEMTSEIESFLKQMNSFASNLRRINNDVYKKMTYWALRDFDLDAMFDPTGTSIIPFNDVRDALFSGEWDKLIAGDYQRFASAKAALLRIQTLLLGKSALRNAGAVIIGTDSWAYRFRSGFQDLRAQMNGIESPVLNNYRGIIFKDADTEIKAVSMFGHETVEDAMVSSFEAMNKDLYAIEIFGTDPMGMVDDLINSYNASITKDKKFSAKLSSLAKTHNVSEVARYGISEGQAQSIRENAALALGMQNTAPATATRWLKLLRTITSISLLAKAGVKGLADYGTIWQNLVQNSFVEGRIQAMATTGKAAMLLLNNRKLMDMVLATSLIKGDTLIKQMVNDPMVDVVQLSNSLSRGDRALVNAEKFSRNFADIFMNKFGLMEFITNNNKNVAALSMQITIADKADVAYNELAPMFRNALLREGIDADDWNFIRANCIWEVNDYLKTFEGVENGFKGEPIRLLVPLIANRLDDGVFIKELNRRGVKNVNQRIVDDFRRNISSKMWNMIDVSSDEMISLPSGRIQNLMTGGKARNSGMGSVIELATQFQSFGASLLYNTFGRMFANQLAEETGVSILDILNLSVRMNGDIRNRAYGALFGGLMTIGLTSLAVDTAIQASVGNIVRPYDENGFHLDNLRSSMLGSLGSIGVLFDAIFEGIEGSGQAGSGFAIQLAPSVSESLRRGYRLSQPLRSSRVPEDRKAEAFAAASAQELARFAGLKSYPVVALVYQWLIGAYLDSMARGGQSNYRTYIKDRERRGYVIMPWERNPQPIWDVLQ